ncbi:topoisomerase DNA-binding C4 zinc finger domain-containing protein [Paenibacillus sp. FSL R7-0026]|uniref:topoisomerase DNA-binding C4 zinc finger domain-containing protein n=1 Tax=Paenibacillus sp. FSL R7-0026 TaxID=2921668 RepID=UPI0030FCDFA6
MIICPKCKNSMNYKSGTNNGRSYEFYGCSTYPSCTQIVEIKDAHKYDNGEKSTPIWELPMEEQKERIRNSFRSEGLSWDEANYLADRWEKED